MLQYKTRKILHAQMGKRFIVLMRESTEQRTHIFFARSGRLLHPAYQRHWLNSNLMSNAMTLPGILDQPSQQIAPCMNFTLLFHKIAYFYLIKIFLTAWLLVVSIIPEVIL